LIRFAKPKFDCAISESPVNMGLEAGFRGGGWLMCELCKNLKIEVLLTPTAFKAVKAG